MTARRRWTEETIQNALASTVAELGRMPTRRELADRGLGGAWSAMQRNGGIAHWRQRLTAGRAAPTRPIAAEPVVMRRAVTQPVATQAVAAAVASTAAITPASAPSRREIEERAYFIFQQRGGDPVANWLAAERQLLAA